MDRSELIIYILIGFLILFGGAIYFGDKTGFITANNPIVYLYSNGDSEFEVSKVNFQNYLGYQIKFYYEGSSTPSYINLRYDPLSLEDIEIDRTIFHKVKDDYTVFITIDPFANLTGKTTIAALEIDKFIDNKYFFNIPVNSSMTKPYAEYPVKTCDNATKSSSVIWLRKGTENRVFTEGECIIVEGETEEDLIRGADRLALYLIGIMP